MCRKGTLLGKRACDGWRPTTGFGQRQPKAGLSEPIGWVMLSFKHDAWQNWSHNDKVETGASPSSVSHGRSAPTGPWAATGTCACPGTPGGHTAEAQPAQHTAGFEKLRGRDRATVQPSRFLPHRHSAATSWSSGRGRTIWTLDGRQSFRVPLATHREAAFPFPSKLFKFSFYKHILLTGLKSCSLSVITRYSQDSL